MPKPNESNEALLKNLDNQLAELSSSSDLKKLAIIVDQLSKKVSSLNSISNYRPTIQFLGWDFIMLAIEQMKDYFANDNPDVIIGMGRGGAILAGLLAHSSGVLEIGVLTTIKKNNKRKIISNSCVDVKNKKIALIDDNINSGDTMREASSFIKKAGAQEIVVLAISKKINAPDPNYFIFQSNQLICYPWDKSERLRLNEDL